MAVVHATRQTIRAMMPGVITVCDIQWHNTQHTSTLRPASPSTLTLIYLNPLINCCCPSDHAWTSLCNIKQIRQKKKKQKAKQKAPQRLTAVSKSTSSVVAILQAGKACCFTCVTPPCQAPRAKCERAQEGTCAHRDKPSTRSSLTPHANVYLVPSHHTGRKYSVCELE